MDKKGLIQTMRKAIDNNRQGYQCRQLSEQKALKHGFSAVMETHIARYFAG